MHRADYSTRSVVVAVMVPEATTTPMMFTDHGYEALTVTSDPCAQLEVTLTESFPWLRSAAEFLTAFVVAVVAFGLHPLRQTAPFRAPARAASVSVTQLL